MTVYKIDSLNFWLQMKIREFNSQGYDKLEITDIQHYLSEFLWKRNEPELYIHKVDTILNLTANNIFDYKTLEIQKHPQMKISEINLNELSKK